MPPRIAAAKPLRPSITPTSQEVNAIGAMSDAGERAERGRQAERTAARRAR
jgi:hypothetical protein